MTQRICQPLAFGIASCARSLQALFETPAILFLATLGLMLFHPMDMPVQSYDRVAFGLLIVVVLLRICASRDSLHIAGPVTWPMFGLLMLALADVLRQPYRAETWSVFAAKWLIPFVFFLIAGRVFDNSGDLRKLEIFALATLAYLEIIAVVFLVGGKDFIFPRFIVDERIGIHADRARGPFLQAVANGLALNLLGLIALDSFRRKHRKGMFGAALVIGLPIAILATKTRAVWLSFAASIVALPFFARNRRLRKLCVATIGCGCGGLVLLFCFADGQRSMADRLEENDPVKFRVAMYEAGWDMFLANPVEGWRPAALQRELSRRISDFHEENYYFHNTYLEILVQHGVIGFALYAWMIVDLFRLGRRHSCSCSPQGVFLDEGLRSLWPVFLIVYLINASCAVMNYQFVNGLLFTLAGVLAAQNHEAEF